MNQKNNTLTFDGQFFKAPMQKVKEVAKAKQAQAPTPMRIMAIVAIAISFLALFSALALTLMVTGIYWAFRVFFDIGWWAALLIMLAVITIYLLALFKAIKMIERKTD